jgi:hypothetical protein
VNQTEDTLRVVADLRPVGLDRLADEGYARRRDADLARLTAGPVKPAWHQRRRLLTAASMAGLAAAAAVAVTLTGSPAPGPGTAPVTLDARTVLLASAHVAAHAPAATGTYWYVRERDFEPAWPQSAEPRLKKKTSAAAEPPYRAFFAETQETWFGQNRTRTIVNEELAYNFASPADKAKWQAAGSPGLSSAAGFSAHAGPVTSDYGFGGYSYRIGAVQVSLAGAKTLPATAAGLDALLRHQWDKLSAEQRVATVGFAKPSYAMYVFQVAGALLTGPATPRTRVAVYELLAGQPGLTVAASVTDPLGRTGTAIGDGTGDYLIINPGTAAVLAQTTYPVRAGHAVPAAAAGTEAYEAMGWSNRLGTPAGS